jgi:hypothetical protein
MNVRKNINTEVLHGAIGKVIHRRQAIANSMTTIWISLTTKARSFEFLLQSTISRHILHNDKNSSKPHFCREMLS